MENEPNLPFIHEEAGSRSLGISTEVSKDTIAIDLAGNDVGAGKSTIDDYAEEVRNSVMKRAQTS